MYSGFGRFNPHLLSLKLMSVGYYYIRIMYTRVTVRMYGVPLLCSLQAVVLSISTAIHKYCKGRNVSTVIHKCWEIIEANTKEKMSRTDHRMIVIELQLSMAQDSVDTVILLLVDTVDRICELLYLP